MKLGLFKRAKVQTFTNKKAEHSEFNMIRESGLFDAKWFARTEPDAAGTKDLDGLIKIYLGQGKNSKSTPNVCFNDAAYRSTHPDVARDGMNPLLHYIMFGRRESRTLGSLFDAAWYAATYPDSQDDEQGLLASYLSVGRTKGRNPNSLFDTEWYLRTYPDVAKEGFDPVEHYILHGADEFRDPGPSFSSSWYKSQHLDLIRNTENPLAHYLRVGKQTTQRTCYKPSSFAPAIGSRPPGWNHLLQHDVAKPRFGEDFQIDPERPKILFVTHEMSRTGAPLIILTLIKHFAKSLDYDFITFADRFGDCEQEFRRHTHIVDGSKHRMNDKDLGLADLIVELGQKSIALAICNTANTNHYSGVFKALGIPTMSLVHEMLYQYPEEYIKDLYAFSDRIIFPARYVQKVAEAKVPLPPGRTLVLPQGLLNPDFADRKQETARRNVREELGLPLDALLVLGCGTVCMRKGVDLFVAVAQRVSAALGPDVHFVWLGSDTSEASYSYWIKKDVQFSPIAELVHFVGLKDDPAPYYQAADLFVMTSREDPFPCVVHEAMACRVPIVAFADAGGAPEALENGSGVVVPYADVGAMATEATTLLERPDDRKRIADKALERVQTRYSFERYFLDIVDLARDALGAKLAKPHPPQKGTPRVFFFARDWWISGVNSFTETLMTDLLSKGIDAELVFPTFQEANRQFLPNLPSRFLKMAGPLDEQWQRLIDFVNDNAPCILVPNYDYVSSAISPALDDNVGIIGIVHSDDVEHYDHVFRLGRYWNSIVCSNHYLRNKVIEINPDFASKATVIPYGVSVKTGPELRGQRKPSDPIRLVYCGRITQHQKRVRDLVAITKKLDQSRTPYTLTVIGDGNEKPELEKAWAQNIAAGTVEMAGRLSRDAMYEVFRRSDVFLLVSAFEGMPISLIEAMGCGCVPIVSDIPSGIPDLVTENTGYKVAIGNITGFAQRVLMLQAAPDQQRKFSQACIRHVIDGGFRTADMGNSYQVLIEKIWADIQSKTYIRPEPLVWLGPLPNVSPPNFLFQR